MSDVFDGYDEVVGDSIVLGVDETIKGVFLGLSEGKDSDGNDITLMGLRNDQGLWNMRVSTILSRKLSHIKEGDQIAIIRNEDSVTAGGRTLKNFKVYLKK